MPYAEYDPLTTLRSLQGAEAMRNSQSERRRRDLETAEMQRQAAEQQQMRQAAAGAVVPQVAPQVQSGLTIGGQDASMPSSQVQGPPALDRAKLYGNIAANPNIAYQLPGVQAQDAKGQLDHQTAMLQLQEVVGKLQAQGDAHSKAVLEQMNTTADQMGRMAMAVKNAPPELKAQIYQQVLQQAAQNPVLAPRVQQLPQQYDPSMEPMLDSVIAQATDVKSALAKAGETVQLGSGPQGAGVYTKNPLQPNVPGAKLGDLPKTVAPAVHVSVGGGGAALTADALEMAAQKYIQDGTLPPMGMGKQGAGYRARVLNRAAELAKGQGSLDNIAGNVAGYKASSASLTQVVKMRNSVEAFENTAGKNLDLFIAQAKKVPDTGIPILNAPARSIAEKMGNENVSAYNTARQVALTEIAKVVNNPNLTGQLSDSARQEVLSFNPASATLGQTMRIATILRADMRNRRESLQQQEKAIRDGLKGGQQSSAAAPSTDHSDIQFTPK